MPSPRSDAKTEQQRKFCRKWPRPGRSWRSRRPQRLALIEAAAKAVGIQDSHRAGCDLSLDGPICSTDAQWAKMEPHCLGKPGDPGRSGKDNRLLCRGRAVDCPHGQSVARSAAAPSATGTPCSRAFATGSKADVLEALFDACLGRAGHGIRHGRRHHRQGPPPRTGRKRGTQNQAIGRSKGGMTTKILALTDALGNLVRFVLLPGQRFDTVGVAPLIEGPVLRRADRRQGVRQQQPSSPTSTNAAPRSSSPSTRGATKPLPPSMPKCTNGVI